MKTNVYPELTFTYHHLQRRQYRNGTLVRDWLERYPDLFDRDDARVLASAHQRTYNFLEWLSAVLLFEATGYFTLLPNYTSKKHPEKCEKLKNILSSRLYDWLCKHKSGQPDLFVYNNSTRDWFFCEVKSAKETINKNQKKWMVQFERALHEETISSEGRIYVLRFHERQG